MKKIILILALIVVSSNIAFSQSRVIPDKQAIVDSLTTLDPNIQKYFPRWKVCEPDLLIQIYQSFLYQGFDKAMLNQQDVEVLAAPKEFPEDAYDILMISCGQADMNAIEIEQNLGDMLIGYLSGTFYFQGLDRGTQKFEYSRDYCFTDIPIEIPLRGTQADAIISYLQPTNVDHAFTLSLFEQAIKIGETGFWLRSIVGTDEVGYHFWSAGESSVVLQRPLYVNTDENTNKAIPFLLNAYLGGGYRIGTGISDDNSALSWVKNRTLNAGPGGKFIGGFDFHMPFKPEAGVQMNLELPFQSLARDGIDPGDYGVYDPNYFLERQSEVGFKIGDPRRGVQAINNLVPILRATGQFSVFYHLWLDDSKPENYFRFDVGMSYAEVQEAAYYQTDEFDNFIDVNGIDGLRTWKPNEFGDWVYAKVEYRNQATYPFGGSIQYSNQILMGRLYLPLFGNWFYLEGKYSTPLRGVRPYEIENFFMISPVLRLTI